MTAFDPVFRTPIGAATFGRKYRHVGAETWAELAETLVDDVCGGMLSRSEMVGLYDAVRTMKFIPGGRYLYYAGRRAKYFNNCFLLKAEEDTRQDWANLSWKAESCLMVGGGIGVDYSVYRASGAPLARTGGEASGPIPKMEMIDAIGHNVMQGGSRRSAIYASLNWAHGDAQKFLRAKDWHNMPIAGTGMTYWDVKQHDYNFRAPLDHTNISLNYDDSWLQGYAATGVPGDTFLQNAEQALRTGEPGFSFNFGTKVNETLRNACCEITSEDDSDVCNLGSVNLSRIDSIEEFKNICTLATLFLLCGTFRADLPYEKVYEVRARNRRLGVGLMGVHEWLLRRGYKYEPNAEFTRWLETYKASTDAAAEAGAIRFSCSSPKGVRAIAPTGSIGILAGTTTGIEPLYSVAYKRRYLVGGQEWRWTYVIDGSAKELIDFYGWDPDHIETAAHLAEDPERRIAFQAYVQDYVDQAISSTINLPAWGSAHNNEDTVKPFAATLAKYAHRLRGFTCYPDAARGGQPITEVPYAEALAALTKGKTTVNVEHHDACEIGGKGGSCGV